MKKSISIVLVFVGVVFLSHRVDAGGPFSVNSAGTPAVWASTIDLHPEEGSCASFTNAQMVTKIENNVGLWENVSGVTLDFDLDGTAIDVDVDEDNYDQFYTAESTDQGFNDNITPIIFDDDGSITDDLFRAQLGPTAQFIVLGFAGSVRYGSDEDTILEGQIFINCRCIENHPDNLSCPGVDPTTEDDVDFTVTHEVGHMIGLDHTQVNQALAGNCDKSIDGDCDALSAMYPQSVDAADQISPNEDDQTMLRVLYGRTNLESNFCTVTGTLLDGDGNALRCADIQAVGANVADTVAVVSGVYAPTDSNGNCVSNCGDFTLRGIDPAKTYTLTVVPIDSGWTGSSGINPCNSRQPTGVEEEVIRTMNPGDCAAGATLALGNVTTGSTGGDNGTGGGDDADDGDGNSSALTTGCRLQPTHTVLFPLPVFFALMGMVFLLPRLVRVKK